MENMRMVSGQEPLLETLGLGVAQISLSDADPTVIEVTYYGGPLAAGSEARSQTRAYRSATPVSFPGEFRLPDDDLELSVERSSLHSYAIAVRRAGAPLARGLALSDRDDPAAIMVAWWTGEAEPYGVVKYTIRDASTVVGYYISKMTPNDPGEDIAIGHTGDGFRGDFLLNSQEVNGRTWGPHEWKLTARGEITDLAWREHNRIFCRGIGMPVPHDSASIIATYVAL
jgi:hypothetical protein